VIVVYLVTRTFQDNGIQRVHGELVVGTDYRTLHKLIELRYLKDAGDSESFRCQLCERAFHTQDTLDEHYLTCHPDDVELTPDDVELTPDDVEDKTPDGDEDKTPEGSDETDTNKEGVKENESVHKGKGKSGKNTGVTG